MKKSLITAAIAASLPLLAGAQTATDAFQLSQQGLRGTARFMSMGGAFTALGGDLSTLNQNPGGIGLYRNSEIGATLDINMLSSKSTTQGFSASSSMTKANCNNFGYIGAVYTGSDIMPYFNWGASYSRTASFDRRFKGSIGNLQGSLTNLIAGYTTQDAFSDSDLSGGTDYNPYLDSQASWMSILAYNSFMITPVGSPTNYQGMWQNGTSGYGSFASEEKGYTDEYAINFGGNISNIVYWGMGFGITDLEYRQSVYYTEDMENASIPVLDNDGNTIGTTTGGGGFGLDSWKHIWGSGFNFKIGAIVRPINELRLGFAVHTPTYYNLKQEGFAQTDFGMGGGISGTNQVNDGYVDYFEWKLRTPWRIMAGVAGVIGSQAILSLDYEYRPMQKTHVSDRDGYAYTDINGDITTYYKAVNILRLGAEYRISPSWSVRAGYQWQSSPVEQSFERGEEYVYTDGPDDTETTPSFTIDKTRQYVTCGLGYRYKNFYADAAYVHGIRKGAFQTFTANNYNGATPVQAKLSDKTDQIVISAGFKF